MVGVTTVPVSIDHVSTKPVETVPVSADPEVTMEIVWVTGSITIVDSAKTADTIIVAAMEKAMETQIFLLNIFFWFKD